MYTKSTRAIFALLITLTCQQTFSQTFTLDWGASFSTAWAPGNSSGTATNIGGSGRNCVVNMAFTGSGAFIANYPAVNSNYTGTTTLLQVQNSTDAIDIRQDLGNKTSYLAVTLTFSQPVQNVSFGISDVDRTAGTTLPYGYVDEVIVTGTNPSAQTVLPTIGKYNPASTIFDIYGDTAVANDGSTGGNVTSSMQGSPSQDGTALYSFSGNAITTITIQYDTHFANVQTDPAQQFLALGNISFQNATPPVTTSVLNTTLANTLPATGILTFTGTDDESISTFKVITLPTAAAGTLTYFNAATSTYVAVTAGQSLTSTEAASLRFDPSATYSGDVTFTFSATDNRGLVSNTSTYTIPVEPVAPPVANNITAPLENNSYGQTTIPSLQASSPTGTISSYTITALPTAAQGQLYLCNSTCNLVTLNQVITAADKDKLKFDPAAGFTGNASFTYTALNSDGISSNTAKYIIPINNQLPVANNILSQIIVNTPVYSAIPPLSGSDIDGTIASYTVTTVPNASTQGTLKYCSTGTLPSCTGTVITGTTTSLTPAQAATLTFSPIAGLVSDVKFTYTSTDNSGSVSPSATYTIPVKNSIGGINIPPYSDNMVASAMDNSNGPTLIPALSAHDVDGTISTYTIESIPAAAQGVLTYCSNGTEPCSGSVNTISGITSLTAAQAATLKFDPVATFIGTASFTYSATDNGGKKTNISNYSLPVYNVPPVANPITITPMTNTFGQTAIAALSGYSNNTITTYTITSVPTNATGGILYLCNGLCLPVLAGQTIAPADIAKLTFDPAAGFVGVATFGYTVTDNNSSKSDTAAYNIPVISTTLPAGTPPVATNVTGPVMPSSNAQTAIPSLIGTDDVAVASFVITSLPPATEGVLYLCNATCHAVVQGEIVDVADAAKFTFDPTAGFGGNAVFNYIAKDNTGRTSNTATYTIPVTAIPPQANNVQTTGFPVSNSATTINALSGSDADGSVASYKINSLTSAASGVLSLCNPTCTPVTLGQVILATDAAKLSFAPNSTYTGAYAQFNFTATDNTGLISNPATYSIPLFTAGTLPLELISFSAEKLSAAALLKWVTSNEINVKEFQLERSLDAVNFNTVNTQAAQNGGTTHSYSYTDQLQNINAGIIYYRLKMIDIDGRIKYSLIVKVYQDSKMTNSLAITPNPVVDKATLRIVSTVAGNCDIRIINQLGEVLYQQKAQLIKGENIIGINSLPSIAKGVYTVQAIIEKAILVQKIVISE